VVVFDQDTPVEAIRRVRPDVWAKGGDYTGADVPEAAVLEEWGGQAVVLPYLQGRSTTQLVQVAAQRAAHERHRQNAKTDKEIVR
jgi:D-beta-D-heptose 7-phosphate kinase/D-beta-D-heptose 1-phosphate adenosyltransferase